MLTRARHRSARTLAGAILLVGVAAAVTTFVVNRAEPSHSDVVADWINLRAAQTGLGFGIDIHVVADQLGVDYENPGRDGAEPIVGFRTPGGLLLLSPLLLFDPEGSFFAVAALSAASLVVLLGVVTPRLAVVPLSAMLVPAFALGVTIGYVESVRWGTMSCLIALLAAWFWLGAERPPAAGGAAAAMALKVYPGIVLIPALANRATRTSAYWTMGGFVGLNLAGWWLWGLSPVEAIRLISIGGATWVDFPGNVSLVGLLARSGVGTLGCLLVVATGLGLVTWFALRRPFDQAMALSLAAAVLLSPLSWLHYDVLVFPVVLIMWAALDHPLARKAALGWITVNVAYLAAAAFVPVGAFNWTIVAARFGLVAVIATLPAEPWLDLATRRQAARLS